MTPAEGGGEGGSLKGEAVGGYGRREKGGSAQREKRWRRRPPAAALRLREMAVTLTAHLLYRGSAGWLGQAEPLHAGWARRPRRPSGRLRGLLGRTCDDVGYQATSWSCAPHGPDGPSGRNGLLAAVRAKALELAGPAGHAAMLVGPICRCFRPATYQGEYPR
jgi:hypothetical protein